MYVENLKTYHIRNLQDSDLEFSRSVNFFSGLNGQGKTNIIESLSILSSGKSFRTSKLKEIVSWGEGEASLHARIIDERSNFIESSLGVIVRDGQRETYLNGDKVPLVDYVGKLLCVTFSPTDIEIVKGSPAIRRRFIDRHSVDLYPALLKSIISYNNALKSKQAILKTRRASIRDIEPWNRVLSVEAAQIVKSRSAFIAELEGCAMSVYESFAETDGELSVSLKRSFSEEKEERIFEFLMSKISNEIGAATAIYGPHRDDLEISISGNNSRLYASQGQSKSIVLALKLAAIEMLEKNRKTCPVVLLDDVDSELDKERFELLIKFILSSTRQVFITGTRPYLDSFEVPESPKIFKVSGGVITPN